MMLFLGLMIHDISEGFALGFSQDVHSAFMLFIGIFLHKWCDVSVQTICCIRQGLTFKQNLSMMVLLVLATPLAQLAAFLISIFSSTSSNIDTLSIVEDVFMSLASGSFIGIAFIEILAEEIHDIPKKQTLFKCLAVLGGIVFILLVVTTEYFLENKSAENWL